MFVERYLELSNELKYRKGESGAYMQLGEILTQKGDYDSSTKHFYRAMKISEDTNDAEMKEQAKVKFADFQTREYEERMRAKKRRKKEKKDAKREEKIRK